MNTRTSLPGFRPSKTEARPLALGYPVALEYGLSARGGSPSTRRRRIGICMAAACCSLLAASDAEDWVREGNAAFVRGEYQQALECYERGEDTSLDPGLVAFNKAAVYYQQEIFFEAEANYRRCLEDASGARRVQALYGLANALVQQSRFLKGKPAVKLLLEAAKYYEECLMSESGLESAEGGSACQQTFAHARHNLEVSQRLLSVKKLEKQIEPEEAVLEMTPPENARRSIPDFPPGFRGPRRSPDRREKAGQTDNGLPSEGSREHQPGRGDLPPLLDDVDASPLDPEQAATYLKDQLERIRRDRANRLPNAAGSGKSVRDW